MSVRINKKAKSLTRAELEKLNKSDLINKIEKLEAYNFQLKNILQKKLSENDKAEFTVGDYLYLDERLKQNAAESVKHAATVASTATDNDGIGKKRKFDFSKSPKRHVLLKILYFGWDYQGFATQEDTNDTIEHHLFKALTRCCLIESRITSNYHRCGRTDKEVSAFCQVISIDLRSKIPEDKQLTPEALDKEFDYCGMLNRVLPRNIQCIAWMPLQNKVYSARFDCIERTYRYYFPKGDLNIEAMREGCKLLERHTDFRNFCKMDVHNGVTNYTRNLKRANIFECPNEVDDNKGYAMYYLEIEANAFLWHQIRCIMTVLLLIGQEKEEPAVISALLDIKANPCKPQYTPASGLPLNLFQCKFNMENNAATEEHKTAEAEDTNVLNEWVYNRQSLRRVVENVQSEWTKFNIKSTMIRNVLHALETELGVEFNLKVKSQVVILQESVKPKQYKKLLSRKRCESLENRIDHFVKKQRLIINQLGQGCSANIDNNDSDD